MRRRVLIAYKNVAIVAFLLMFAHVSLLLLGCPLHITEKTVFLSPVATVFAMSLSWALKYCITHRACLLYTGIVSSCIKRQQYGEGFGDFLFQARFIVLVIGILVCILLLVKKIDCHEKC